MTSPAPPPDTGPTGGGPLPLAARLLAEFLVIVVGVLVALSGEAWWQGRGEEAAEVRHLEALSEDLRESRTLLVTAMEGHERLFHSLERLLDEDLAAAPTDSVARWVYDGVWMIGGFEPRTTAIRDLESSGQLGLLSPEVRRGIADLTRVLADHEELERDFTVSQQRLMDPFLVDHLALAPILARADSLDFRAPLPERPDWSVLDSRAARSRMAFKISLGKIHQSDRRALLERIDALSGLVDHRLAELARPPTPSSSSAAAPPG